MNILKISLNSALANEGLPQADFEKALHKSKTTITNWENGKTEIDLGNLQAICNLYKVTVDDILLSF